MQKGLTLAGEPHLGLAGDLFGCISINIQNISHSTQSELTICIISTHGSIFIFFSRLADVLTVINNSAKSEVLQQPAICPVLECGGKMFVPEKVVVDTAAVDELIQKFKNGLEVRAKDIVRNSWHYKLSSSCAAKFIRSALLVKLTCSRGMLSY